MSPPLLHVVLSGHLAGRVERSGARLRFFYDAAWRRSPHSVPLSVSMPLAATEHGHRAIEPFLWGLLPDNPQVLQRWGQRFHVSAGNPFALLQHVGEECPGAVQLVTDERLESVLDESEVPDVTWLKPAEVAHRLRVLVDDHSMTRLPQDHGQFSLAGAQPKTALFRKGKRWGVPHGKTPTTHILKPPALGLEGHAENEHLMLALARSIGIPTASSQVLRFGDQKAIVVERYDRVWIGTRSDRRVLRVHQEDLCQALSVPPTLKYQNEGGPAPAEVMRVLRQWSSRPDEDTQTFLEALLFNWLVAGTDAHAKNYSLLLGEQDQVRLAPLYDLASALPYDQLDLRRLKLAMKLGGKYALRSIGSPEIRRMAQELGLKSDAVAQRAREMAQEVEATVDDVLAAHGRELEEPIVERLRSRLRERAQACSRAAK